MVTQSPLLATEPYLTVSQAARHLSVHPSTLRRWIDQGRLPAYRLGEKRIAVKASDLAGLVAVRPVRHDAEGPMAGGSQIQIAIRPLTPVEQERGLRRE